MILITGSFGSVGTQVICELLRRGREIRTFDRDTKRNRKHAARIRKQLEPEAPLHVEWGDIRDMDTVEKVVAGSDTIIHLAACIPPAADKQPDRAAEINVTGTKNIIEAAAKQRKLPHIIFSSSIAVYGDRRQNPYIGTDDPVSPNDDDHYGQQKVLCEEVLRKSNLPWTILRLTYITDIERLKLDPLMFSMPLETCIEICDVRDAARAIANTVDTPEVRGMVLNIGGGECCRTTFGVYLSRMFQLFGLGKELFGQPAFSTRPFHCGFLDSERSEQILVYQSVTLSDFYENVKQKFRIQSVFLSMIRPVARLFLLSTSPLFRKRIHDRFVFARNEVRYWCIHMFCRTKPANGRPKL